MPLSLTFALVGRATAQTVRLEEAPLVDACYRAKLTLDLHGKITFLSNGKTRTVTHAATAEHVFVERVLQAKGAMAEKAARVYEVAKANIAGQPRVLRPERSFMVAHRIKDQLVTYSPKGPLFDDEMDLTEHFDMLALPGLLPGKEVKVGENWGVPPAVVQAICGLDGLDAQAKQALTCELKAVQGNRALIEIRGIVKGIQLGAPVSIVIGADSRLHFDLKDKRIVKVEWRQNDERPQGPANPNLSADVTIFVERTPIAQPAELNDFAMVQVPAGLPTAKHTNIEYRDPKEKYSFEHSREWQFVGERDGKRILKLLTARGDYVSDAILMPWRGPKIASAKDFKEQMDQTPGWEATDEAQLDEAVKHPAGYTVYRVAAPGKLEGAPAFRTVYLIGNTTGQQMLITFITPPNQVNNLETRDLTLVESIELK
jgi:hypothetical protein